MNTQLKIKITNDITKNTVRKMIKHHYFGPAIEKAGENNQTMENLNNDFITREALKIIVDGVFYEKKDGSFPKSTGQLFFTRNKCRFIKGIFVDLLNNGGQ